MEWSKSKTYIIIAFLITNFILLLSIYSTKNHFDNEFNEKSLKNLEKLLEERNVKSKEKLSIQTYKLPAIELKYATLTDKSLSKLYKNYKDSIKVIDDLYIEIHIQDIQKIKNIEEFEEFTKKFIRENLNENEYRLKNKEVEDDEIVIVYEEWYQNMYIEQGYLNFRYDLKNSVDISLLKTKDITKVGKEIEIMSNAQAISKLIPQIDKNETIEEIQLSYYVTKDTKEADSEKLASLVRLIPFWRVKLNDETFLRTPAIRE